MLFQRYKRNPIISPDSSNHFESEAAFNPTAVVYDGKVYLLYRAEGLYNEISISTLCLAISDDGYNFKKHKNNPIIKPTMSEEKRGCEDPRITQIGDTFYLTYTAYDGMYPERSKNIYTALATSKDLINWEKKGIILRDIKAAAICPEKINGKYIMFIGGMKISVATSTDLLNWELDPDILLDVREDKFDSRFVEAGPAPFVFQDKLVLFYNSADSKGIFNPSLALLDKKNPRKILYRADKPLMSPLKDYEVNGRIKNVIFADGLIEFNNKYFYYYGGADTCCAVATVPKKELEDYIASLI